MKRFLMGASALALLMPVTGLAQTATTSAPSETIVVIGYLEAELPQELAKVGTRITTVSADDIKNGAYLDVTQSLQTTVPGLYISPTNGPFDYVDISFQGSRTSDVLWLVDGIRINNRLYSFTTPLDTIPASMIERIEALESGQALFYGTQAAAGAVNVVTKSFSNELDGQLSLGGDSNEGRHIDGFASDSFGRHQFVLFGSHDESDGYQPFPDADFQPSATDRDRGYEVTTLGGKYGVNLTDTLRLSASYLHTDAQLDDNQPQLTAVQYNERDEDLLTAKVDFEPSDIIQLYVKGYYHWWDSYFTEFDNTIPPSGTLDVAYDHAFWGFKDYGVNVLSKIAPGGPLEYFAGYDFQNYSGRDDVLVIQQQTERVHAFFGQLRTTADLFEHARFSVGVRHNLPSVGEDATVWNVSGQVDLTDNLFVRANGGTAFRLPTAEELFADDPGFERGNPNLKPERSTNVNVSIGGNLGIVNWEVIGYWREIKDLIDYATFDAGTGQDVFGNIDGKVKTTGAELVLNVPFTEDVSLDASYTYNKARASGSSIQFDRIPEQLIKGSLDYHPMSMPFGASVTANYVGDVFRNVGGVGRVNYGDYVVVDIGARYFVDAERRHRIGANLNNVFDEEYTSLPGRGTTDVGGASYLLHNLGLPRTLVVNYTYAFN